MAASSLFAQFYQGINWNAFSYLFYKILSTLFHYALFFKLPTIEFATWANINSMIFLLLLWLDFGLRKSIPRYLPAFAQNAHAYRTFLYTVFLFQGALLIAGLPLFIYGLTKIGTLLKLSYKPLVTLAALSFVSEGVIATLRLIFHAHFWNKYFNTIGIIANLVEIIINTILLVYLSSASFLINIFVVKIIINLLIIIVSCIIFVPLYKKNIPIDHHDINVRQLKKQFLQHSAIMWVNNSLKSLSERNFLMPAITYYLGPVQSSIFKIANDSALFFYRSIIKTIGINDTALLAHIEVLPNQQSLMPVAFKKVMVTITALCLPLLGIIGLLGLHNPNLGIQPFVFQLFFILLLGYLIELILSPYVRILEVKRNYWQLLCGYSPYIIMIAGIYFFNLFPLIGLLKALIVIHGVRLVSSCIMVVFAQYRYDLQFPVSLYACVKFLAIGIGIYAVGLGVYMGVAHTGLFDTIKHVVMGVVHR